jgi:Zn-finger protein
MRCVLVNCGCIYCLLPGGRELIAEGTSGEQVWRCLNCGQTVFRVIVRAPQEPTA